MSQPPEALPHVYPFRFADRVLTRTGPASGRVRAVLTANQRRMETSGLPPLTLLELMAQAALLLQGGDAELGKTGFLAGFSDFEVARVPEPGDVLDVDVRMAARLGPVVKFEGRVSDDGGRLVATGALTVRTGTEAGSPSGGFPDLPLGRGTACGTGGAP